MTSPQVLLKGLIIVLVSSPKITIRKGNGYRTLLFGCTTLCVCADLIFNNHHILNFDMVWPFIISV